MQGDSYKVEEARPSDSQSSPLLGINLASTLPKVLK